MPRLSLSLSRIVRWLFVPLSSANQLGSLSGALSRFEFENVHSICPASSAPGVPSSPKPTLPSERGDPFDLFCVFGFITKLQPTNS